MAGPLQIAVIADDLTGAADTGVQFCPALGPVYLDTGATGATGATEAEVEKRLSGIDTDGLALSTNSRHLEPDSAAESVRQGWAEIRPLAPTLVYKKLDSVLRGNLGAEIDALCLAMGATASFIAPAFPGQGRTTRNDIHLLDGVPVAETEIGRDPRCPVRQSRLTALLAAQSSGAVGHMDIACIDRGVGAMAKRVRQLLDEGTRHIAFDALSDEHLDGIVALTTDHFPSENILLAGSAGLAESLARQIIRRNGPVPPTPRPSITNWLMVCGSISRVMVEQTAHLARSSGWPRLMLDGALLAADEPELKQQEPRSSMILSISPPAAETGAGLDPGRVITGMAKAAYSLMDTSFPQGLFLSGGDTAQALLAAIDTKGVKILEQILPGLMRGEIVGGPFNQLPVITKAGAFGAPDTLTKLINLLK